MVTCVDRICAYSPDICNNVWQYCCSIVYGDGCNVSQPELEDIDEAERLYDVTKLEHDIIIRVTPQISKKNCLETWTRDLENDIEEGAMYRQGARRWRKCYRYNGHTFAAKRFHSQRAICAFCSDRIWGIGGQGYKCLTCKLLVHKRCHKLVQVFCQEPASSIRDTLSSETTPIMLREHMNGICTPFLLTPGVSPSVTPNVTPCLAQKSLPVSSSPAPTAVMEDLETDDDEEPGVECVKLQLLEHSEYADVMFDHSISENMYVDATVDRASLLSHESLEDDSSGSVSLSDFTLRKVIGRGSYAKVFLVEHKKTKLPYAMKVMRKEVVGDDDDIEWVMTEKHVLQTACQSPFLVGLHSCFQTPSRLFFITDFVPGGDMMTHMQRKKRLEENHVRFYAAEISLGLHFLHRQGVIYRDLKLDNVLLDKDGHVKLTDYGMCKEGLKVGERTSTFCGTPNYIAPEILRGEDYGPSVDWWALGVLMFEMMAGRSPFDVIVSPDNPDLATERYLFQVILERTIRIPRSLTVKARSALQGFLTKNPADRLGCNPDHGFSDIKTHLFFRPLDWAKIEIRQAEVPWKPSLESFFDVQNFDGNFTEEIAQFSPDDREALKNIDQSEFEGFDFVNPDIREAELYFRSRTPPTLATPTLAILDDEFDLASLTSYQSS